jgi:hypothetical protein
LTDIDIEAEYSAMLPSVNNALRNYVVSRIADSFFVPPSRIEPKLKALARGSKVTLNGEVGDAVNLELRRAAAQTGSDDPLVVANHAARNVRLKIERNKKHRGTSRNKGDRYLTQFYGSMGIAWIEHTGGFPGVTNNEGPGGPFLEFVSRVLLAFAEKIPDDLAALDTTLKPHLRATALSKDAGHSRFRKTRLSTIPKIFGN